MIGKFVKLDGGRVVKILDKVRNGNYMDSYLCEIFKGVDNGEVGDFIRILPDDIRGFAKEWEREQAEKYFNRK